MFALMLILPIIASFAAAIGGRGLGITGTNIIVLMCLFSSTLLSLILGYEVILGGSHISLRLGSWFDLGSNGNVDWGFLLDPLGAWLAGTVLVISFVVHIFATSYMASDPAPQRFMCLLVAFTGSMVILVTGDSLGVLFLGWELIGITSFLLIGYWWDRTAACNAAIQALIINRVGDFSFTLALMILLSTASTLDLNALILWVSLAEPINSQGGLISENLYLIGISWVGIFLVIAAFGKSAQFLLHTWLPLSMEGFYMQNGFFMTIISKEKISRTSIGLMLRNKKGQSTKKRKVPFNLSDNIEKAIIGDLLGDGCLRVSSSANTNMPYGSANLAFTF